MFLVVCGVLGPILLGVSWLVAPKMRGNEKARAYECGFRPLEGQTRDRFRVGFYLVGILFLLFDLELLLTFPVIVRGMG